MKQILLLSLLFLFLQQTYRRKHSFTNEYIEISKTAVSISWSYRAAVHEELGSL